MGCDIHLYLERKNKEGKWCPIEVDERILPDDRFYALFYFLAGVRYGDQITPQFPNRGVPEDSSVPLGETEDWWLGDHSFTHIYLDEIEKAPWEESGLHDSYFIIFFKYVLPRLVGWISNEQKRDFRVIIGFDN